MEKKNARVLAECGILIALGTVLSLVKIQMPLGGSITLFSMLPLVLICWRHGINWGFPSALVYSFLQIITGVSTVSAMFMPGDDQMLWWKALIVCLLDYVFAYTVICVAGLIRGKRSPSVSLCLGTLTGLGLRYLCHIISGAIFYGAWAEWYFTDEMGGAVGEWFLNVFKDPTLLGIVYSVVYNGSYMIPEIIITVIGAIVVGKLPFISKNCSDGALPEIS